MPIKRMMILLLFFAAAVFSQNTDSQKQELDNAALEQKISKQVDEKIKTETDKLRQEISDVRKRSNWLVSIILLIGFGAVGSIYTFAKKKFTVALQKGLEGVDPRYVPIKVPSQNFEVETKKLKWSDFRNIKTYRWLDDSCKSGCVIVPIRNEDEMTTLRDFIEREKPDESKVSYILYTKIYIKPELYPYPNVTFANSPLTIGQAVLIGARGIK